MDLRKYELMFITYTTSDHEKITSDIEQLLESIGAKDLHRTVWGNRRLAYPIRKQNEGFYVIINFKANPVDINKIEKVLNANESLLRYMVTQDNKEKFLQKIKARDERKANRAPSSGEEFSGGQILVKKDYRREPYIKAKKEHTEASNVIKKKENSEEDMV